MKKLFKPANIGFYFLMLLSFFLIGLFIAGASGAGKNQGLAGGAIVVGYGIISGGIALIASFFIAFYNANIKTIIRINWILLILILCAFSFAYYKFSTRTNSQKEENKKFKPTPSKTVNNPKSTTLAFTNLNKVEKQLVEPSNHLKKNLSLGFFKPNYYENPVFYFYGNLNLEKSLIDHTPYDSITFKRDKYNQIKIATAPPWLVPIHLKLDYGVLYFTIQSVTEEFIEVTVNETNGKTAYVNRRSGDVIYWTDFLLGIHSVEFKPNLNEKVRSRAFEASSEIKTPYEFMRAIQIKDEWMQVLLLNDSYKKVGKGWIQWKRNNEILIQYNLFS